MPRAPRRCPGDDYTCPNTITSGAYCPDHQPTRGWDSSRTGGQGSTRAWRKTRLVVLQRDGYQCQLHYDVCTSHATEVDHIDGIAVTGIPRPQALNPDRLRAVCHDCHKQRTQQQAADGRRNRGPATHKRQPEAHPGSSDDPHPVHPRPRPQRTPNRYC